MLLKETNIFGRQAGDVYRVRAALAWDIKAACLGMLSAGS